MTELAGASAENDALDRMAQAEEALRSLQEQLDRTQRLATLGTLAAGKQADLSVLEIKDGDWMLYDILGDGRKSDKAVLPVMAIKKGEVFEAGWGPRPWGWEPDSA